MFKREGLMFLTLSLMLINLCFGQDENPNIVWITSEDNSKHYLELFDEHGAKTPNIERLAEKGLVFSHAYSNAPVCSSARSTLISGAYGPRMASHYHRNIKKSKLPGNLEMFPAYLKKAGYYTSNNAKEDYNFEKADNVWDDSSEEASWKNRKTDQPFFHVFNIHTTHEANMHFSEEALTESAVNEHTFIQPNHPQSDLFKYSNERYLELIKKMDMQVGEVIDDLEKEGLLENTFVFYFGDHGGVLPGSKGYVYETGVHIPLVVYVPPKYKKIIDQKQGTILDAFVSFVDFGATVLHLAGVQVPEEMDGRPFLGKGITSKDLKKKNKTYSYADRFDEKYDMVRAIREGRYKYIRNYQPFNFDGMMNNYRFKQLGYQQWQELSEDHKLNDVQSKFFKSKSPEELYDIENDPYETKNLADDPAYQKTLLKLRKELVQWTNQQPDLSFYPEFYLIENALDNPKDFGIKHQKDIASYVETANLMLMDFDKAEKEIATLLKSSDPWQRYWALICCSSFGKEAYSLTDEIRKLSENDPELINKVRAAEYLGLITEEDPTEVMTEALYSSQHPAEALLILNSVVLMQDGSPSYDFSISLEKLPTAVRNDSQVQRRLDYLNVK